MKLRYVGASDEVECLGRVVKRGGSEEFTAEEAGAAPSVSTDDDGNEVTDPGSGLLAQPDNWQPVKAAAKTTKEG